MSGNREQDKIQRRSSLVFLWIVLAFLSAPPRAIADGPERIENVKVETLREKILISARLNEGFRPKIVREINNGIQKEFFYYILVKRKETNWIFDEEILSKSLLYTVKFDTLKKKYKVVFSDGEKVIEKTFDDFEAMKEMVMQVNRVELPLTDIKKSPDRYYVSVKVQMKAAKLPLYLDYFLFFIPFLEIDTPWSDSEIISFQGGK
ncbi:MAG: DUF4390 domain-containing protein [Nitrospiria bacterium]